jgi:ribonuclease P protein subunit POP4
MITPENVLRHELIGLKCTVISSSNSHQNGIEGKIVDETRKTILIETANGMKQIQKQDSVLRLKIPHHTVEISGNDLIAKPEDRIKKKLRDW